MHDSRSPKPRLLQADRSQLRLVSTDLDRIVGDDDQVRSVWAFVEGLDLSGFYSKIKAVEGEAGRPPIDPKILMALWIQATLDGVGSAREVARLCEMHARYQWICGGVIPGYHRLSDFRSESEEELDVLLTDTVAVLMHKGLVNLERVAQDGMRVRASAGAGSFRTGKRLRELRKIAGEQVKTLKKELDGDAAAGTRRRDAARRRAAEERARRIKQALAELPEIEKRKKSNNGKKKTKARSSTTDPDARVMKMADGGFRPALNVHFVTDTKTKVIAAVEVNNHGTDQRTTVPLAEQVNERYDKDPAEWLEDGGCVTLAGVETLADRGTAVIAPIRVPRTSKIQADRRSTQRLSRCGRLAEADGQ
ncbi:MAG TPA: IS1182 family transposase [Thermoanaerobaculia bacterium]|nr:IS1182 family transposase [Thermoanaerobaculia bacterium]